MALISLSVAGRFSLPMTFMRIVPEPSRTRNRQEGFCFSTSSVYFVAALPERLIRLAAQSDYVLAPFGCVLIVNGRDRETILTENLGGDALAGEMT